MQKLKELFGKASPVLLNPTPSSLTISISKRFFLFQLMKRIVGIIEEDPRLNFIALLKSYKILGRILTGTVHDFYRDRNRLYFKKFFYDEQLYRAVKKDIESLYPVYRHIGMTITKRGVIVYDNYRKNAFNVLLLTIHSGIWVPYNIKEKMAMGEKERFAEEDVETDRLYRQIVLNKAGIWIDNKQSRFVIDFNRALKNAVYTDNSEEWLSTVWKEEPTEKEKGDIISSYQEFYFTLSKLIESFQFNIIFDGHSMKDGQGRPDISFGTQYIPSFYMPIVISMLRKMQAMGYRQARLDTPYKGGFILRWLSIKAPNLFICSMEINKRLYMKKNQSAGNQFKVKRIANDLVKMFDIESQNEPDKQSPQQ